MTIDEFIGVKALGDFPIVLKSTLGSKALQLATAMMPNYLNGTWAADELCSRAVMMAEILHLKSVEAAENMSKNDRKNN